MNVGTNYSEIANNILQKLFLNLFSSYPWKKKVLKILNLFEMICDEVLKLVL